MRITTAAWNEYIRKMSAISEEAANKMQKWIQQNGFGNDQALLDYAFALSSHYGEAIGALACDMYEKIAEAQGVTIEPAEIADVPEYGEVARAVHGTMNESLNKVPATVGRLVKRTGADTTLKNAIRDGAEFAWVPYGDTCAFCITLASRGWQQASKKILKNGHAEHIHAHCDCQYAIRLDGKSGVEGYKPEKYLRIYYNADPDGSPQDRINAIRRMNYALRKKDNYGPYTTIVNPVHGKNTDVIKPQNIIKELGKSDVGRRAEQFIKENNFNVQLVYNVDNPDGLSGIYNGINNEIVIYADVTKTIKETAKAIIHETTHGRLGSQGTRKEEVLCFMEEAKHDKVQLTPKMIKDIIKYVNSSRIYKDLPWR